MLSTVQCRNAKAGPKPYKLTDGNGLYLEVRPTGGKFWRFRYEVVSEGQRRERLYSLGSLALTSAAEAEDASKERRAGGRLTLAEARNERDRVRGLVRQGICPTQERKRLVAVQHRDTATTFELVAEEWLTTKHWAEETTYRRQKLLARVVYPHVGALPVKAVTSQQLLELLQRSKRDNGPTVAAEVQRTLSSIFGYAIATLRADVDPTYAIRKALPANKTQHKRPLSQDEVGQLLRDIGNYDRNHQTVGALTLMWLTLCRPGEVIGAAWAEIDWQNALWRIPAARMKTGQAHVVPLPRQAIDLLKRLHALNGGQPCVFPHRDNRNRSMTEAALRQALGALGWRGKFSPHATRATGSTILNERGYNRDWIERQLAHKDKDSARSAYNQATHLQDRRSMMQTWADLLDFLRQATMRG